MISGDIKWITSVVARENFIYCMPGGCSAIYRLDLDRWTIKKVFQTTFTETIRWSMHEQSGVIYCIPHKGIRFVAYDPRCGKADIFESGDSETELAEVMLYDQKLWFIPRNLPGRLYCFSIKDGTFSEDISWIKELRRLNVGGRITRWFADEETIYLVFLKEKRILQYNLFTHLFSDIRTPVEGDFYDFVHVNHDYYWIEKGNKKTFYKWNQNDNSLKKICGRGEGSYVKLVGMGDAVLLDADTGLEIWKDNVIWETGIIYQNKLDGANHLSAVKLGSKWVVLPWGREEFIEFENDFKNYTVHTPKVPIRDFLLNHHFLFYESGLSLKEFIEIAGHDSENSISKIKKEYGNKIYNFICGGYN